MANETGTPVSALVFDENGVVTTHQIWGGDALVFDDGTPVGEEGTGQATASLSSALLLGEDFTTSEETSFADEGILFGASPTVAAENAISGNVTVPITVTATVVATHHESIAGAVTVLVGVAANMQASSGYVISGNITVSITVAATLLDYTQSTSITGDVTVGIAIAASTTIGYVFVGSVSIPITVASVLWQGTSYVIVGALTVPIAVAANLSASTSAALQGSITVLVIPSGVMQATQYHSLAGNVTVSVGVNGTMFYTDADTLFTANVYTDLIGVGPITTGNLLLRPASPWVVWNGVATRPAPIKVRIKEGQAYQLDGLTPARVPPSYVASGVTTPIVIFPENNYYRVEVIMLGRTYERGYLKVPFNPASSGVTWYEYVAQPEKPQYIDSGRYALDTVKTYANTTARNADISNLLPGTIVYTTSDGNYWGRNKVGFSAVEFP